VTLKDAMGHKKKNTTAYSSDTGAQKDWISRISSQVLTTFEHIKLKQISVCTRTTYPLNLRIQESRIFTGLCGEILDAGFGLCSCTSKIIQKVPCKSWIVRFKLKVVPRMYAFSYLSRPTLSPRTKSKIFQVCTGRFGDCRGICVHPRFIQRVPCISWILGL
jgi:hypothetical protein